MTKEQKAKWVEALRSGKYKQHKQSLAGYNSNGEIGFCCLGVYCEAMGFQRRQNFEDVGVMIEEYMLAGDWRSGYLPDEWLSPPGTQQRLANMNDKGVSFEDIADTIERTVRADDE